MCILLCAGLVHGQVKQFSQPINFSHLKTNDTFSLVIQNTDTAPVEFYPLTVFDNDSSRLFETNTSFLNYIQSAGDPLAQIYRLAYFLKSDRFVNNYLVFAVDDAQVQRKKNSAPMFFLGNSQEQCRNYRDFAVTCLVSTGAVSFDSIFSVSLAEHQVAECIINGDSILLDFDPAEPTFLNRLPNGKFYSALDVYTQPQYMNELYMYTDPVTGVKAPLVYLGNYNTPADSFRNVQAVINSYTRFFDITMTYEPPYFNGASKDTGTWRLPPASSIEWHWQAPLTLSPAQVDSVSSLISADASFAEIIHAIDSVTGFDSAFVLKSLVSSNILLGDTSPNQLIFDNGYQRADTLDLYVTTTDQPVVIGRDLRLPFWVHRISTDQPVTIGDTTFPAGNSCMWLWNEKNDVDSQGFSSNAQVPLLSVRGIEKLQSGIIPAHCHVHMSLYYNERIYAIPNGLRAEMITNNFESLVINGQSQQHTDTTVIPTAIAANHAAATASLHMYPNPTNGNLLIDAGSNYSPGAIEIYNNIGVLCLSATLESQVQLISIANLASGLYTVKVGNRSQKVVKL